MRRITISERMSGSSLMAGRRRAPFEEPADPAPLTVYQIEGRGAVVSGLARDLRGD